MAVGHGDHRRSQGVVDLDIRVGRTLITPVRIFIADTAQYGFASDAAEGIALHNDFDPGVEFETVAGLTRNQRHQRINNGLVAKNARM